MSNTKNTGVYIFDIDGTLADLSHRLHYIKGQSKNYYRFFGSMGGDSYIEDVGAMVNLVGRDHTVVFMSGRPDSRRQMTEQWLRKYNHDPKHLYMRTASDHRPDYVVKLELYQKMLQDLGNPKVLGVFDDRPQVIEKCWRQLGLTVFKVGNWDKEDEQSIPRRRTPTLTLLIGPSRAGKSTFAATEPRPGDISSDVVRGEMLDDWTDQSHNDAVFQYIHKVVDLRLKNGMDTCVDATNIRNKDRKAFLDIADEDCHIVYLVFDRPLEDKIRDRGLIPEVIVRKHDSVFRSNLKDILAGDGDPRVTVVNMIEKQ